MSKDLEDAFHQKIIEVYDQAKRECRYTATQFHRMVNAQPLDTR